MDVVTGALGNLLPKLLKLLGDEYKLQTETKKQVKFITRELDSIQVCLLKVGGVPWDQLDKQVKVWAREAREASYNMEDVLDTFFVRIEIREPANQGRLKRALKKMASLFSRSKARRDIGCAIHDIKNRLQEIADRRARYKIDDIMVNSATATSTIDPRLKAMYKEVASLVGIEEPSEDLISKLSVQGDDTAIRKKIVAIVGIGGLGKTTLAKAVYDKLGPVFDCEAFIPVGRNPSLTKVLSDILYELDKNKYSDIHTKNRDQRQLIDNLRKFLINKRYFIVIDDIWENKSWETIELALLENNYGSRIMITTRNIEVATNIGDEVYKMQPLSDSNSKKLFHTRIFGDDERCPDNQPDDIPYKILKTCDGVPLAIITMASLLVGKPRESWFDVFTSIGFGHKDDTQVENTMKILSYSYYDMPAHLRTCLLYLSVFPEDYKINKESLIWKWIAEGFIQGKQRRIWLYELGEQYFNDLVNRSMVQAEENVFSGTVEDCHVHDMVLDLLRSISSEENFVTILDVDEGTVSPPPSSARRLALHGNIVEHTDQGNMMDMPQVRSFIAIRCAFGNGVSLSKFEVLRVLEMDGCNHVKTSHLVHIGNLVHLRYLGLERTYVDELPNEIGALKLLQILNINKTSIRELTPYISRLTQLVCLKCDLERTHAPNWIGKLTSLEELQIAIPVEEEEEENVRAVLKELGSLRELRVFRCEIGETDDSMQRELVLSLRNMNKLQHLEFVFALSWIDVNTAVWGEEGFVLPQHLRTLHLSSFRFSSLPSCITAVCLTNLTQLSLCVDAIDEKGLEFLGRLPELYDLVLLTKSTVTMSNISAGNRYFQKLRSCSMHDSMIQFQWKKEESSFSFHIWNGNDAMPFGCNENSSSIPPSAVMPNLEWLICLVSVRALKDVSGEFGNIGLQYLSSLQYVMVYIDCSGASAGEVDDVKAALRKATEVHPNRPTLEMNKLSEDKMISTQKPPEDDNVPAEEHPKQGEGEPIADEGISKSSIVSD